MNDCFIYSIVSNSMQYNCIVLFYCMGIILHAASSIPISMRDPLTFLLERGLRNGFEIDCNTLRDKITFFGNNRIGQWIPQCEKDNTTKFTKEQCQGSTGYCWCSLSNGKVTSKKFRSWESYWELTPTC